MNSAATTTPARRNAGRSRVMHHPAHHVQAMVVGMMTSSMRAALAVQLHAALHVHLAGLQQRAAHPV